MAPLCPLGEATLGYIVVQSDHAALQNEFLCCLCLVPRRPISTADACVAHRVAFPRREGR